MTSQTRSLMFWKNFELTLIIAIATLGIGFGAGFGWALGERVMLAILQ